VNCKNCKVEMTVSFCFDTNASYTKYTCPNCGHVAKGEIIGFDDDGKMTRTRPIKKRKNNRRRMNGK
jgi:transcription initiation factor TFIIIB Brf1 subunit/transcription initiation factor TFIIB